MINLFFRLFLELIFSRAEEYDHKSKHFKPGKVIFAGIVVMSVIFNFVMISTSFRISVKYMELTESHELLVKELKELKEKTGGVERDPVDVSR